eukprot:gene6351-10357_t
MLNRFMDVSCENTQFLSEKNLIRCSNLELFKKLQLKIDSNFPSVQNKINIVIPTTKRRKVNYNYLIHTLTNLTKSFEEVNIDFKVNTFSTTKDIPFKMPKWNHFQFEMSDISRNITVKIRTDRDSKIEKQTSSWIEMMKIWKKKCPKDDIFLYMEDDFIICPQATVHLYSLYHTMKMRKDLVAVKFGFGLNGIILRCNELEKLTKFVEKTCFVHNQPPFPVDWAVGDFYSDHSKHSDHRNISYTYRYNLFEHIGKVSSVANDDVKERAEADCFGPMYHQSVFMQEKFEIWDCPKNMISPCGMNSSKMNEYSYRNKHDVRIDYPFSSKFRRVMLNQLKFKDIVGMNSCEEICESRNMKCLESGFPLINNCEWMKKTFGDCKCEFTENLSAPYYNNKKCFIKRDQPFSCNFENDSFLRICPCQ